MRPRKKILDSILSADSRIETTLLRAYLIAAFIWAVANALGGIIAGLPLHTVLTFAAISIGLLVFFVLAKLLKAENIFREVYFILVLLATPVLWYVTGGYKTASNILFVCEFILYIMCMRGTKQKIYLFLSLISVSLVQNIAPRLPVPVLPMEQRQYSASCALMGLSTMLLIASLLLKQKAEYSRARNEAITTKEDLEKSNQLQKNFLANMSHEIRSPLGIVMGFNNLIMENNDIDQIHEYSKDIKHAGSTLLAVINDILDYSKIESGKLDIIEADYSFKELVKDISCDIGLKCDEKGLSLVTDIDPSIPECLRGDKIRIKQCLINLLSNAVKYTDAGTVTFSAKCIEKADRLYKLQFSVKDTGKGIAEDALGSLYTAFQRLDLDTNRGIEGTGLGLAITKNLLDEMHGTIDVQSTLGVGSEFTVVLNQLEGSSGQDKDLPEEAISIKGLNILAVDDTQINLTLLRKILQKDEANITALTNGKDCLEEVAVNKYDVILLDHMMPEMNGVEVFKQLKAQNGINKDTPVIMLTANAMAGAVNEYLDMGFDGYVSKPISHNELLHAIANTTYQKRGA